MSDGTPKIAAHTPGEFRDWLEANHASESSAWLILWKKSSGRQLMTIGDAIDQALCFGWVDSKSRSLDDNRYLVYFSVRKRGSGWSKINKNKIAKLEAAAAMAPAGTAAVARAKEDGSWTMLDGPEAGIVPPDLKAALEAAGARHGFDNLTPGARKAILTWLVTAKRDATRQSRIERAVAAARDGKSPLA
ncbi:MAG: hypothetical protein GY926_14505 [bacterium]|nr:hypothetical protein [bacterium]